MNHGQRKTATLNGIFDPLKHQGAAQPIGIVEGFDVIQCEPVSGGDVAING